MSIDFQRNEYKHALPKWQLVDSVCTLEGIEDHLITLNDHDTSVENRERNAKYKERAVAYPIAGHTLEGLVGLLFSKDPKVTVPTELEYLLTNADGTGVSIYQQAQDVAGDVASKGRAGLWTTFPQTDGAISQADINAGLYVATIHEIEADRIINWRTTTVGAQTFLSLVVFTEEVEVVGDDGYEIKSVKQLRELALDDGVFAVREWQKNEKTGKWEIVGEPSYPTDRAGNTLNRIPFSFVGSRSNSSEIDNPPMLALSKINLAHFRNSADFEDSCWYVGQAQPWMSGVTQAHVNMMKENKMYAGSRTMLAVPDGGQFAYASAAPNPLVRQAMLDKVDMMIGIGARFIQETGPAKTATESNSDDRSAYSQLAVISGNLSEAYTAAIQWAGVFMGSVGDVLFETTKDFISPTATAQEIQAIVAGFVQGAIPMSAYFNWMQRVGLEDEEKTIDQFAEEVGQSAMPDLDADAPVA